MATATENANAQEQKVELKSPSNREFLQVYVPLARAEKTAAEISKAFNDAGFEMDAAGVSTKAAQLRAKFKRDGVDDKRIKEAVPTLKREGRKGESSDELLSYVDDLIGAAGEEVKEVETPTQEETPAQGGGNKSGNKRR